jgi:hypothetical protein
VDTPVSYSRRGGAAIGFLHGSWPLGKIVIENGAVTVSVMGRSRTLSVAEVLRVEPLGLRGGGPGVRIVFRGKHWDEHVDFYSISAWREVLAELKNHGFTVVDPQAS